MIKEFTSFGYSVCSVKSSGGTTGAPTSITDSYQAFPVTVDRTNARTSDSFPDDCNIQAIEFEFAARDTATEITMYLARDSAGDIPITNPSSQTITNGLGTATKGGCAFSSLVDYHFDAGTSSTPITGTSRGTIYVIAKHNAGSSNATGTIRVSWRA
tara:strand:+ start:74 stop:544 length:471 start_codon:yes stop_codon:yes gene_type:complete